MCWQLTIRAHFRVLSTSIYPITPAWCQDTAARPREVTDSPGLHHERLGLAMGSSLEARHQCSTWVRSTASAQYWSCASVERERGTQSRELADCKYTAGTCTARQAPQELEDRVDTARVEITPRFTSRRTPLALPVSSTFSGAKREPTQPTNHLSAPYIRGLSDDFPGAFWYVQA
jgi:hypothetical protein